MLRAWEVLKRPFLWLSSTPRASRPSWAAVDAQGFAYSSEHHTQLGCPMHGLVEVLLQAAAIRILCLCKDSCCPEQCIWPLKVILCTYCKWKRMKCTWHCICCISSRRHCSSFIRLSESTALPCNQCIKVGRGLCTLLLSKSS